MSHSLSQVNTSRVALEQAQGAGQNTVGTTQAFPCMVNGIPDSDAGCAALDSIAGGIRANQSPLQISSAIDVAQSKFGNRSTLQFVHRQLVHHIVRAEDVSERHADRVSTEPLLGRSPGGGGFHAVATSDAPVQMTGGSLKRAGGQIERKKEKEPEKKKQKLSGNVPPPLGVSRKYNPVSREMTIVNEIGVDPGNPRNRRELRTAGDIVGPLPGPAGHRE